MSVPIPAVYFDKSKAPRWDLGSTPGEALRLASEALRDYLDLHKRGGHLAPWLRDGKRFRVVDARDQAYARGDWQTRDVAGALLALTREELETVRRAADVPPDIGRVQPEET